jgi:hypothetical protein
VELRDLIVTPLLLICIYVVAYLVRPKVTDPTIRKYFLPALSVRIIGALAVGFIYQFYYDGGDTFNYHTHGSRHVWQAFIESPEKGIKLLFSDGSDETGIYKYSSRMLFFKDPTSYVIVRIAAVFDLITFSSYSATAVLFSLLSFIGLWLLFITFYRMKPHLHGWFAAGILFVPSVIFWGSGLLKDTITMAALGAATYSCFEIFNKRRLNFNLGILLALSLYVLYKVKIYILLTFLPAGILWIFFYHITNIRSAALRYMLFPFVIIACVALGYLAVVKASEDNPKYSIAMISKTAQITAYDIRYWTGRDAGSGYSLGELDGTWESMVRLAPQAINVSLFRPYIWEVRNPLMLLSAFESIALLGLTLYVIFRARLKLVKAITDPTVLFCLTFSVLFAFAVGISTFNFGTLARYKIPLLPFYVMALVLILDQVNKERKEVAFDITE